MATGNIKASKWSVLINAKKETPNAEISQELEAILNDIKNNIPFKYYFAIVHDKDKNKDGTPKRTHLHVVLEYAQKRTKAAVLEELVKATGVNQEQIGIDATNSDQLLEQYLIHKNDTEKHSYDKGQIITNNVEELEKRLATPYLTPEEKEERNLKALMTVKTFKELIQITGLDYAHKYRPTFNELRAEQDQDLEGLNRRINYLTHLLNQGAKILADILPPLTIDNDKQSQQLKKRIEFYLDELKANI